MNIIISLTARRVAVELISIESRSISSFYRSSVVVEIKLYVASFGVLPIIANIKLFKYDCSRNSILDYYLRLSKLLR